MLRISYSIHVFELFVNDREKNTIDRYETENGIVAEESAQIERDGNGDDVLRAVGFYLYIGDDGKEYRVDYTADAENGFVAKVKQNIANHSVDEIFFRVDFDFNEN